MSTTSLLVLTNTEERAKIDTADTELVSGFRWRKLTTGYVEASRGKFRILLHRLIIGAGPEEIVDHINGDPLDNRTSNLRISSHSQNSANRGADRRRLGTSSIYKGVSWSKGKGKWVAYLHHQGRTRYLGYFLNERDAAIAYDREAIQVWGDFARLNIPEG